MTEWFPIESDPGIFTELIKNIGVKGIQVEDILDLETLENSNEPIYGLIFLFKYIKNSGYTPNVLLYWDNDLFFAKQIIENACATQAILGILLNNSERIDIGITLKDLKSFTMEMDPINKGLAISNNDKIKTEHNKFSHPEPFIFTKDIFHFVSYVHFKNAIYEIDGLQEGPILIEKDVTFDEWIKKVKPSITNRINLYSNNEIKFNLLAVMPNQLEKAKKDKNVLYYQKSYIDALLKGENIVKDEEILEEFNYMNKEQLNKRLNNINYKIKENDNIIKGEEIKMNKYKEEKERKQHNFIPFIFELLKVMEEKGFLKQIYKELYEKENKKKEESKK